MKKYSIPLSLSFSFLMLIMPMTANARCCSNWAVGSDCCNIFSCNCSGPCSNYGCSCPPVTKVGSVCGTCPGYNTCTTSDGECTGSCKAPANCCNNGKSCCSSDADGNVLETKKIASCLPPHDISTIEQSGLSEKKQPRELFYEIDSNDDKSISLTEAKKWLAKNRTPNLTDEELKSGFEKMDVDKNGSIQPSEFDSDLK